MSKTNKAKTAGIFRETAEIPTDPIFSETVSETRFPLTAVKQRDPKIYKPHPLNEILFSNSEERKAEVRASIRKSGILQPVIVYKETILSGHVRCEVAKELGFKLIPVRFIEDENTKIELSDFEQISILIGDNESAKKDTPDMKILRLAYLLKFSETVSGKITESEIALAERLGVSDRMIRAYKEVIDRALNKAGKGELTLKHIKEAREEKNVNRKKKDSSVSVKISSIRSYIQKLKPKERQSAITELETMIAELKSK